MDKKAYMNPELDITKFRIEDILTVSGSGGGDDDDEGEMGGGIVLPDDEW